VVGLAGGIHLFIGHEVVMVKGYCLIGQARGFPVCSFPSVVVEMGMAKVG